MKEKSHEATPPPAEPPLLRPLCTILTHARSSGCQQHSSRRKDFFTASTRIVHRRLSFRSSASAVACRLHCTQTLNVTIYVRYVVQVCVHAVYIACNVAPDGAVAWQISMVRNWECRRHRARFQDT